jgi:selenium metabolism protein YedF
MAELLHLFLRSRIPATWKETRMTEIVTVDARGLACPQPVLETRKALEQAAAACFRVLVDNVTARENVTRFARNQGCAVSVEDRAVGESVLTITKPATRSVPEHQEELLPCPLPETAAQVRNLVYIGTNTMGRGDDELGTKLMRGFLRTCIDVAPLPWRMIFINAGVKLTTIDDDAVQAVTVLQDKGVEILSCGTCLQHFGLEKDLKVGKFTNMFEVIESFNAATKVISPD